MSTLKTKIGITLSLIVCAVLALVALGPSGMATTSALAKPMAMPASAPIVNSDGTVTFSLRVPGATHVYLNLQNMVGASPAYNSYLMSEDTNGVWSITIGPTVPGLLGWINPPAPLDPNLYAYGFNIDGTPPVVPPTNPTARTTATAAGGVNIADPANRNIASWSTSAWSTVLVPGPAADFLADNPAVPHGTWATVRYYSNLAQKERQMTVYTPPGYNHDNRVYPVFYLLHGGGGNDTDWTANMWANYIMDNLIAQKKAVPMIVVMPDVNADGFPSNSWPDELLGNIVPYIEQNYRAAPGGQNRALAGLSLGGLRTTMTVFSHPGEFAYAGVFSGGFTPSTAYPESLLDNPDLNKLTKLLWISAGNPTDIAYNGTQTMLARLDNHGVNYTYVDGPSIGATGGHVWDTWRKHLFTFAQLLFK
jgi:enterochelin esterase-like enzyme